MLCCRYGHQVWEESAAGGELVSVEKLGDAYSTLLQQHYKHTGCKPGCLIVYRDGVSDAELDIVRRLELAAIAQVGVCHVAAGGSAASFHILGCHDHPCALVFLHVWSNLHQQCCVPISGIVGAYESASARTHIVW